MLKWTKLILGTLALAVIGEAHSQAATPIASIYGAYDAECGTNIDCSFGTTGYAITSTGGTQYDNPSLFIVNSSGQTFTNATLTLTGYQDQVTGQTATISLPNIAANTILDVEWGSGLAVSGDTTLFSYDYDDQFGGGYQDLPGCVQPYSFCTYVGNFNLAFNATTANGPVSSIFSPDPTQTGGNQQGTFVGFEGLDPTGLSETVYDDHFGSQPGVLAYIYNGTTGTQTGTGTGTSTGTGTGTGTGTTATPEPMSAAILLAGLAGLGATKRRRV